METEHAIRRTYTIDSINAQFANAEQYPPLWLPADWEEKGLAPKVRVTGREGSVNFELQVLQNGTQLTADRVRRLFGEVMDAIPGATGNERYICRMVRQLLLEVFQVTNKGCATKRRVA